MHNLKENRERLLYFLQRGGEITGMRTGMVYQIATPTIKRGGRTLSLIDISMNFTEGKAKFTYLTLDNRFGTEQESEIIMIYPLEHRFKVYFWNRTELDDYYTFNEKQNNE